MSKRCAVLLPFAIACGSHSDGGPDAAGEFVEAPHGAVPVLSSMGGKVLANPIVRPIFFANDQATQTQIEDFLAKLAASDYWTTTLGEYGIGKLTIAPTIVSTDAPPTTDAALDTLLKKVVGTDPDQSTIYSVFLPSGVVLTSTDGSKSCNDYGAYHDETKTAAGKPIIYALMPRCVTTGQPDIIELTVSVSHEIGEAVTDPFVETAGAFGTVDKDHMIWAFTPGAENGDFCEYLPETEQKLVGEYFVQRMWSNASAAAGHDPCLPAMTTHPFVGAAPLLDEDVTTTDGPNGAATTKGVKVAMGTPKTIDIALYSDVPTDDFTVEVDDVSAFFGSAPELTFKLDKTTGHNGDVLHLTITRTKVGSFGGSEFLVSTKLGGVVASQWWGYASN